MEGGQYLCVVASNDRWRGNEVNTVLRVSMAGGKETAEMGRWG